MPGSFPFLNGGLCNGNSITLGTNVAPSTSADTKGSWVQLTASCPCDVSSIMLGARWFNTVIAGQTFGVDVGIGGAGSETVLIPNVAFSVHQQFGAGTHIIALPIAIPAGTRIAARSACNVASGNTPVISLSVWDGAYEAEGLAGYDTIGWVSASTHGTAITSGNAAKGSYVQLVASSAKDYVGLFGIVESADVASPGTNEAILDVAIGAAASEKIIIPDAVVQPYSTSIVVPFLPIEIPAATRISARLRSDAAIFNVTMYGGFR